MTPERQPGHVVEEALRVSEQRYRNVVEGSLQGILIHQDGLIRYANPALARMFDYDHPDELVGRPIWHTFVLPENVSVLQERTRRILAGEPIPPHAGWRAIGKTGRDVWVATAASRIEWQGRPAVVSFYLDVTAAKHAEEERRRLETKILHAQKLESLGVLAGGIAHDFNNLLTAMLGYSSLVQMELPPGSTQTMVGEIEKAALRAADLTRQLLAYAGQGKFVIEPIDLSAVVREMSNLLGSVVSKNAMVRQELAPAPMAGDATQIRQIVMNLITNASDALTGPGWITLRTGTRHADAASLQSAIIHDELPAGEYAYVQVADTGCGMPADILARVFDPFFTTKFTGRGLGLAAVLGIVRGHRGTVYVSSTPGAGSSFEVLFPARAAAAASAPVPPPTRKWQGHGTILVVDDEPTIREMAARMLQVLGFSVLTARDGRDGLTQFEAHADTIVAVLLDLTMPGLDGAETLQELRRIRSDVRVVLNSGYGEEEVRERLHDLKPTAFVSKPYRIEEIQTMLGKVLQMDP